MHVPFRRRPGRAALGLAAGALALTGVGAAPNAANAAAPAPKAKSALINGATVTADPGILKSDVPISLEQYAAERAGFAVTVVTGDQWAALTTADFAKYQLLIVGDNHCDEGGISSSVGDSLGAWGPAVMGTTPGHPVRGNRVLSGLDPEYHFGSGAVPTDPADPSTSPAEHFVEASLRFAGAIPGATGVYLSPGCNGDYSLTDALGNALSASGTGFASGGVLGDEDAVRLATTPGATFPGLVPADLPNWGSTSHTGFHAFPADWRPLAIAEPSAPAPDADSAPTARATGSGPQHPQTKRTPRTSAKAADPAPTCATEVGGGEACGDPVVVFAGADPQQAVAESRTCLGKPATILGTPGPDVITGTPGRDVIVGLGGDDRIRGKGGKDLICAGDGNDVVRGGAGKDRLYGQGGNDELRGGDARDHVSGGVGNDRIFGGNGPDRLTGNDGDDKLYGGDGPDNINGGNGNDVADGGPGKNFFEFVEKYS